MNLNEALTHLKIGRRITRKEWEYGSFLQKREFTSCYRLDVSLFQYDVSILDSNDWIVVGDEEIQEISFADAVLELRIGNQVKLKHWVDCWLELENKEICLKKYVESKYIPSFSCLCAEDWEIFE